MVFEGDMDDVEYKTSEMVTADKKDTVITKVAFARNPRLTQCPAARCPLPSAYFCRVRGAARCSAACVGLTSE